MRIPKVRVCPTHQAPWDAFCAIYFADNPEQSVFIIKGSRGLAGKSWLVALLGTVMATTLRGDITILGGSGIQSARVLDAMGKFWAAPNAPRQLLSGDLGVTKTEFKGGQKIEALTASQKSARGPHPLALLLDEVDEMELTLFDAAMGQTMDAHGFMGRTAISSTHQYADGTMTEILKRAAEKGWPVFEWCWRETLEPHGWLTQRQVTRKRAEMTTEMWRIEVELGEPSIEGRAIDTPKVERMFVGPEIPGGPEFPYTEIEPPVDGAHYATGADWARTRDYVEIVTFRDDVFPLRLVAYQRFRRKPTPYIVQMFELQIGRYPGEALHDSTSLGGQIMDDFVGTDAGDPAAETAVGGFNFGRHAQRRAMFTDYIIAIEQESCVSPRIKVLFDQHKFVRNDDLWGPGHPPDGFVAASMAYKCSAASTRPLRMLSSVPPPEPRAAYNRHPAYNGVPPAAPVGGLARALSFLGTSGTTSGTDGHDDQADSGDSREP